MQAMYGQRTAEALQTAPAMTQIRMAESFAHIISEHAGILSASAIYSFGSVTGARHLSLSWTAFTPLQLAEGAGLQLLDVPQMHSQLLAS